MDVKVLGAGCANCHRLEERVVTALAEIGDDSTVEMVTDFARIAGYGVMTTPALRRRRIAGQNRILAIGDTAGYVEPFTGEGMTWAMQSGILAADSIANHQEEWLTIGSQWRQIYEASFQSRKFVCRVVASAIGSSWGRRVIGPALATWPGLARPLVRRLNSRSIRAIRPSKALSESEI